MAGSLGWQTEESQNEKKEEGRILSSRSGGRGAAASSSIRGEETLSLAGEIFILCYIFLYLLNT
jgi:hypothetical protein